MWKYGINLEALCLFLGITNPKDWWINWNKVVEYVANWRWKEVEKYCESDAKACYDIYNKFKEFGVI